MSSIEELADIDGWFNTYTGTWHAIRTCARSPAELMPLSAAVSEEYHLCKVCCSSREWYDAAQEAKE